MSIIGGKKTIKSRLKLSISAHAGGLSCLVRCPHPSVYFGKCLLAFEQRVTVHQQINLSQLLACVQTVSRFKSYCSTNVFYEVLNSKTTVQLLKQVV